MIEAIIAFTVFGLVIIYLVYTAVSTPPYSGPEVWDDEGRRVLYTHKPEDDHD